MKRILTIALPLVAVAATAVPASAGSNWQNINVRPVELAGSNWHAVNVEGVDRAKGSNWQNIRPVGKVRRVTVPSNVR